MEKAKSFINSIPLKLISIILAVYILFSFVFVYQRSTLQSYLQLTNNYSKLTKDNVLIISNLKDNIQKANTLRILYSQTTNSDVKYILKEQITKLETAINDEIDKFDLILLNSENKTIRTKFKESYVKLKTTQNSFEIQKEHDALVTSTLENQVALSKTIETLSLINDNCLEEAYKQNKKSEQLLTNNQSKIYILFAFLLFALVTSIAFIQKKINKPLKYIKLNLSYLTQGNEPKYKLYETNDQIGQIAVCVNKLTDNQDDTIDALANLAKNSYDTQFEAKSSNDLIYKQIKKLKSNMILLSRELDVKKDSESERDWVNFGLAKFSNILRENNTNLSDLYDIILQELIQYIGAVQGVIFSVETDENEEKYIIMQNSYAYDVKKIANKKILFNEGLVGRCAIEQKIIYLTDVPPDYLDIYSGLGESKPVSLLLFPLVHNQNIYGIIELAFFKELELYEREFAEKLGDTIASSIFNVKINTNTAKLLEQAQMHAMKMALQEKIMRRQLDELKETQKEATRKEEASLGFVSAVNHTVIRADFDLDGKLLYANSKFYEIMEYTSREAEGKHYSTFLEPEDRADFNEEWQRISHGGKHFEKDVKYKTKTGHVYLFVTYTIVRDAYANLDKVLFLAIDTSNRISKELEMTRIIDAFEKTSIKAEFALDGTLMSCSERFLEVTGLDLDAMKGKNIPILLKKEGILDIDILWQNAKSGIEFNDILIFYSKNRKKTLTKVAIFPIEDRNGNISKIILLACHFNFYEQKSFALDI